MATHSSILAWEMPWTEEPGSLQSMGSQRVRGDVVTKQQQGCLLNDSKKEAHKLLYQKLVLLKKIHCDNNVNTIGFFCNTVRALRAVILRNIP